MDSEQCLITCFEAVRNLTCACDFANAQVKSKFYEVKSKFIFPIQLSVGVIGNIITFLVLTRPKMHSNAKTFLSAMVLTDIAFFLAMIPFHSYGFMGLIPSMQIHDIFIRLQPVVMFALNALSAASIWLALAVTFERLVAVRWPLHASLLLTKSRIKLTIGLIFLVCGIANIFQLIWRVPTSQNLCDEGCLPSNVTFLRLVVISEESLGYDYVHASLYVSAIIVILLPLLLLLVLNAILLATIHCGGLKAQGKLISCGRSTSNLHDLQKMERKITMMVSIITITFFVCNLPSVIVYVIQSCSQKMRVAHEMVILANMLVITGKMSNVFLYCFASRRFRKCLVEMIRRRSSLGTFGTPSTGSLVVTNMTSLKRRFSTDANRPRRLFKEGYGPTFDAATPPSKNVQFNANVDSIEDFEPLQSEGDIIETSI